MRRYMRLGVLVLAALLVPAAAMAVDEALDAQLFRPSIFNGHFLAIEDAQTLDAMCWGFGLYFNFTDSLVELKDRENDDEFKSGVLEQASSVNLTLAFSPWSWLSLGVDVPYHVQARGKSIDDMEVLGVQGTEQENISALGDIKAEIKLGILNEEKNGVLGLALAGIGTFPTGDPDHFLGEGTTNFGGKLAIEKDLGIFNIAANGGYLVRPEKTILGTDVGNAYLFGAGVSRDWKSGFGFSLEYWGQQYSSSSNVQLQANPMEVTGTLRYKFGGGPRIIGGGGGGMGAGVGSPTYRLIAGFDYYPECEGPTEGKLNVCVEDPEGNPVNNADLAVEGAKPFKVNTGGENCYSAMVAPGAYDVKASKDGYKDGGKSLSVSLGKTTNVVVVLTPVDTTTLTVKVRMKGTDDPVPGIFVTLTDAAGKDTKHKTDDNGVWDVGAYAPQAIKVSTVDSKEWAGSEKTTTVVKNAANVVVLDVQKKIVPIGKVHFAYDSDVILSKSFPVLENVYDVVKADPSIKKLTIEGHASSEGTDAHNMDLSKRRAASVRKWLIEKGLDPNMLVSVGYGETKPIAPNDTEAGREENRRVEFIIN